LTCLGFVLSGCAGHSRPSRSSASPPLDIQLDYASGTTLSGPSPVDINSLRIEDSYSVTIQLFALEEVPPQVLEPIQKSIRLVMISPQPNFLAPIMPLTPGMRVALRDVNEALVETMTSGQWGPIVPAGELTAILPPHVIASVDFQSAMERSTRGNHLRLLVARQQVPDPNNPGAPREELEMALVRSGRVPPSEELTAGMADMQKTEQGALEMVTQRVALMPVPLTSPYRCILLIPFAWESPWAGAMGLYLTLKRVTVQPPDAAQLETFAQCVEALMRADERLRSIHSRDPSWAGCLQALEQLVWRLHWRRALVDLTHTGHTVLARDLALGAPSDVAHALAGAIYTAFVETPAENLTELSWLMEKTAYEILLKRSEDEELSPALSTYLLRHAGQLGRQVITLREQLYEARDMDDLERRLVRENRIALEDMSPAARSRAYSWLLQRGQAPLGYDPLASIKDRRTALQAALEGKETPFE
jgi:hypothetical protein